MAIAQPAQPLRHLPLPTRLSSPKRARVVWVELDKQLQISDDPRLKVHLLNILRSVRPLLPELVRRSLSPPGSVLRLPRALLQTNLQARTRAAFPRCKVFRSRTPHPSSLASGKTYKSISLIDFQFAIAN